MRINVFLLRICNARVRVIFLCFFIRFFCHSGFYRPDHTKAAFMLDMVLKPVFVCLKDLQNTTYGKELCLTWFSLRLSGFICKIV